MLWACPTKLRAHAPHALPDGEPCGRRQRADRPDEGAPRSEDEPDGDDDDPLGAASDADVAAEAESLGARACVADEERPGDGGEREADADEVVVTREDERDRAENDAFADPVGRRVEKRSEGCPLPAGPRERPVEDVEDRADDEDAGGEPVEEDLVPVLEEDEDGRGDAEPDAAGRQRVGRDAGAREAEQGAAGEQAGAVRVAALQTRGLAQASGLRRASGRAAESGGSGAARRRAARPRRRRRRRA